MVDENYDEHHKHKGRVRRSRYSLSNAGLLKTIVVLVVAAGFFYGGIEYQKHSQPTSSTDSRLASSNSSGFGGGSRRFAADRVVGQVTAISPTSISIQDTRTDSDVTLTINSATTIENNGQTATTSDIQVGTMVFVTENSSNTAQASRILVNPSYGGFGGGGSGQSGSATIPNATSD